MSSLARFHDDFIRAVVDADAAALAPHVTAPRFAARSVVYRNTVYSAAIAALASSFPTVEAAAGRARFRTLGARYLELRPSRTRSLVGYGRDFALVLRNSHEPDATRLADLAKLDRAWLEAHLAVDDRALTAADLANLAPEALMRARIGLRAGLRFVLASNGAVDFWSQHRFGAPAPGGDSATTLVWRPQAEVQRRRLADAEAQFLLGLAAGDSLDFAARAAIAAEPDFDVAQGLAAALTARVFAAPSAPPTEKPR